MKSGRSGSRPVVFRLTVAISAGLLLFWYCAYHASLEDFAYAWRAANRILSGRAAYLSGRDLASEPNGIFLYPLPAALVAVPLARLPRQLAGAAFFAMSTALFAYALAGRRRWRLVALASPAFVFAAYYAQWSPLVSSGALLPGLAWVGVAKPNLWLAALAYRPRWTALLGGIAFLTLGLIIEPGWPYGWLAHLSQQPTRHTPPLTWPLGFVGLVGLLRWRQPGGRALAAMTLVPLAPLPYDHLMLWLVPRRAREAAVLTVTAWIGFLAVLVTAPHDLARFPAVVQAIMVASIYVPAAVIAWSHPNVGAAPVWVERLVERWPAWLRGARPSE